MKWLVLAAINFCLLLFSVASSRFLFENSKHMETSTANYITEVSDELQNFIAEIWFSMPVRDSNHVIQFSALAAKLPRTGAIVTVSKEEMIVCEKNLTASIICETLSHSKVNLVVRRRIKRQTRHYVFLECANR